MIYIGSSPLEEILHIAISPLVDFQDKCITLNQQVPSTCRLVLKTLSDTYILMI